MDGFTIDIEGDWAHFKKPETNNNPLTHDFITKTALIGLIGAVLGKERSEMKPLFPKLSEGLLYGVRLNRAVKKESWAFTMRKASNLFEKAPKQMEFLKSPQYTVAVAMQDSSLRAELETFTSFIQSGQSCYTPVLGLHNCPARLGALQTGVFESKNGDFSTQAFITAKHKLDLFKARTFRVGFERMPTFQDDDFWNRPEKYVEVIYPDAPHTLSVQQGDHFEFSIDQTKWVLI